MESEFGTVRNGSELSGGPEAGGGRPPRMSDVELDTLVMALAEDGGQLPTLDDIIQASGGCQRSRAVAARRRAAQARAAGEIDNRLRLPPELEARQRAMMREWLTLAREQVQPIVQAAVDDAQERIASSEATTQDARTSLESANARCAALMEDAEALQSQVRRLERRLQRLVASEARWRSRAEERAAEIDRLSVAAKEDTEVPR